MGNLLSSPATHAPPPPKLPPLPATSPVTISDPALGSIQGSLLSDPETGRPLCKRYLDLPYAQPMLERWRRAQPLSDAFRYGAGGETYESWGGVCPQRSYGLYSYKGQGGWGTPKDDFEQKHTEDCLEVNVWTPVGSPPKGGWPVLFYIHGGWLQVGDNNQGRRWDPSRLLSDAGLQCVIIAPGYRLNLFGFLACKELVAEGGEGVLNLGLWDQRCALEWAYDHAHYFGGDNERITVAGLSAGAHSTHWQLMHSIKHPYKSARPLIKQIIMYSNAVPASPRPLSTSQAQYAELLGILGIDPADRPLEALRKVPADTLVSAMERMDNHMFRTSEDGVDGFCGQRGKELEAWANGESGRWCKAHGVRVLLGEMDFEEGLFGETNPALNHDEFHPALLNYYSPAMIAATLPLYKLPSPDEKDPQKWLRAFGVVVADGQVYSSQRLAVRGLAKGGMTTDDIFRYRINWRPKVLDAYAPPSMGVTHGQDSFVWWYSHALGVSEPDLPVIREWLAPMQAFLDGRPVAWGTTTLGQQRVLTARGEIEVKDDERKLDKVVGVLERLATGAEVEVGQASVLRMGM